MLVKYKFYKCVSKNLCFNKILLVRLLNFKFCSPGRLMLGWDSYWGSRRPRGKAGLLPPSQSEVTPVFANFVLQQPQPVAFLRLTQPRTYNDIVAIQIPLAPPPVPLSPNQTASLLCLDLFSMLIGLLLLLTSSPPIKIILNLIKP